jgi:hypothetical protein
MNLLPMRIPSRIHMHTEADRSNGTNTSENNLGYRIPEGSRKKNPEDQNPKKGNSSHALIAINFSPDDWIVNSGTSHHMASTEEV